MRAEEGAIGSSARPGGELPGISLPRTRANRGAGGPRRPPPPGRWRFLEGVDRHLVHVALIPIRAARLCSDRHGLVVRNGTESHRVRVRPPVYRELNFGRGLRTDNL